MANDDEQGQMAGVGSPGPNGEIPVAWSIPNERPPTKGGFVHRPHPYADAPRHHMTLPVIETERLWLTGFHDGHLDAFARIQYDPRVAEWFGGMPDPPHDVDRQREETWRAMAMFLGAIPLPLATVLPPMKQFAQKCDQTYCVHP